MNIKTDEKKPSGDYIFFLFMALLPFFMFHWTLPFVSKLTFFLDAVQVIQGQVDFLFAILKKGNFPLHLPINVGEIPASFLLRRAQLFLPFPYIAAILPGYWQGLSLEYNVLFQFLTIPVGHIALYLFLRKIGLSRFLSFLLSTIAVYNTRCITCLYTAGPWAAHLFLCAVIGLYYLKPTKNKGPLLIIAATYWLVVSPREVDVYYGMLCAGLFTAVLPFFLSAAVCHTNFDLRRAITFWTHVGGLVCAGLLLSSASLAYFFADTLQHSGISQNDYAWAIQVTDTIPGILNNFFSPVRSSISPFGATALYLSAALIPLLTLLRAKIPPVIWFIYGLATLAVLHMMGQHTPVHHLAWKYLPLASYIRYPGRISMILPILFLLLLVWIFKAKPFTVKRRVRGTIQLSPRAFLGMTGLAVLLLYLLIPDSINSNLFIYEAGVNIEIIPPWVEPLILFTGLIAMGLVTVHGLLSEHKRKTEALLCLVICLHLGLLLKYNTHPFLLRDSIKMPTIDQLHSEKQKSINVLPNYFHLDSDQRTSNTTLEQCNEYVIEPFLGKIYKKYLYVRDRNEAYRILNHARDQDEVVIEGYISRERQKNADNCADFLDTVDLVYSTYNRMVFNVQACQPAFFVFGYAKSDNWKVWVNGDPADSFRANGYAQAVRIPAGTSRIEFRYWSRPAFYGMAVSCLSLALIGIFFGFRGARRPYCFFWATGSTVVAASLFFLWHHSLYTGDNFNTRYHWESPPVDRPVNQAYNKKTRMSSRAVTSAPKTKTSGFYKGRYAVDGGRTFPSCCLTDNQKNPWWEVDLGYPLNINMIVIYTTLQGYEENRLLFVQEAFQLINSNRGAFRKKGSFFNNLPLILSISANGDDWKSLKIDSIQKGKPLTLKLDQPESARYIRIMASGTCRLCLDEVELY